MKDFLGNEIIEDLDVISIFSKEKYLNYLEKNDKEFDRRNSYQKNVKGTCRFGVKYMIETILHKFKDENDEVLKDIKVINGLYQGSKSDIEALFTGWHCWLETKYYYLDLTICQFDSSYPEYFIIKKEDALKKKIYVEKGKEEFKLKKWLEWESKGITAYIPDFERYF